MGVSGAGNFQNDEAMDYTHELVDQMIEQIEATVASEYGMYPDEPDNFIMMCNVELIWLIGQHTGLSLPEAATVEAFLACADARLYRAKLAGRNRTCSEG